MNGEVKTQRDVDAEYVFICFKICIYHYLTHTVIYNRKEFLRNFERFVAEGHEPNEAAAMAIRAQAAKSRTQQQQRQQQTEKKRPTYPPDTKRMKVSNSPVMTDQKRFDSLTTSTNTTTTRPTIKLQDDSSMSEDSSSESDSDDESLDLARLKRMVVIARDLHESSKMEEEVAYDSMMETISFVFGSVQNFVRSFDSGKNLREVESSFQTLFMEVPRLVRNHLLKTLKELVESLANSQTMKRIKNTNNDEIRVFVLLPMAHRELESSEHHSTIIEPFCVALSKLNNKSRHRLCEIWSKDVNAKQFEGVITMLHTFVTLQLYTWEGGAVSLFRKISCVLDFMRLLFEANELYEKREGKLLVSVEKFYNEPVNREINFQQDVRIWLQGDKCFCKYPFIMNAANKALALRVSSQIEMSRSVQQSFMALFTGGASELTPYMILRVRRDHIVRDSLQQLQRMSDMDLRKPLKVKFEGEEGVDEGGVQKEYFQVITRELIDPKYGMFISNKKSRTLWLNGRSFEAPVRFELIGTLLGVAVHNSVLIDLKFPSVLYV